MGAQQELAAPASAGGIVNHGDQVFLGGLRSMKKKSQRWAAPPAAAIAMDEDESRSGRNEEEPSTSSSIGSASVDSSSCFSDNDDGGDEASSSSSSSGSSSNSSSSSTLLAQNAKDGSPLYELSELMAQLPIKRGLSSFYQGKSQSFTSLGSVKSLEDLVKKTAGGRRGMMNMNMKMRSRCKSFCVGLERGKQHLHCYGPKPAISKGSRGGSCFSSLARTSVQTAAAAATCFD